MGHLLWKISAAICIFLGLGIQSLFTLNYAKYHLTQETRDVFYLRNVGYYNVVKWINKNLNESNRIGNSIRYLNYLIEIPYYSTRSTQSLFSRYPSTESQNIYNELKRLKITHIMCDFDSSFSSKYYFETITFSSRTLFKRRTRC